VWIEREKATALPATQAHTGNEFIFHPHGWPRDAFAALIWFRYVDVDSGLGTNGDSASNANKTAPTAVDEMMLD
jgi:hypothetical protein